MKNVQFLQITFYLNGQLIEVDILPSTRAIDLIRDQLGLMGTKEVCSEGDCGACTIAIGRQEEDRFIYRSVTSCIFPASRLHGCHIVTVEGLAEAEKLHLIQQMLLSHHATQCGYCTPGFVMSMFCLFANNHSPSKEEIMAALEGNLCRCTGYQTIYEAAQGVADTLSQEKNPWKESFFPSYMAGMPSKLQTIGSFKTLVKQASDLEVTEGYFIPRDFNELFRLIEQHQGKFQLITGGTDLIVNANLLDKCAVNYIDLSAVKELNFLFEKENKIFIGASTTYSQLFESALVQEKLAGFCEVIRQMASQQIRNVGSLAGNIAHASPVADGVVGLLGLGAEVVLKSKESERKIPLTEFYQGYQKTVMTEYEVIAGIEVSIPSGYCGFEKGAKRVAVDISKICSFVNVELENDKVVACRIAFGGVDRYPTIAKKSMKNLVGKILTEDVINEAANFVYEEFRSVVDTRSEPEYRRSLIKNQMIKHLSEAKSYVS